MGRRQRGLLTVEQWVEAGGSRSTWYRALEAGRLHPVHPGVARLPGAPTGPEADILAAVLAYGDGARASHQSAAFLHGVELAGTEPIRVTTLRRNAGLELAGVAVHRPTDPFLLGPVRARGVPATAPVRTIVDCGTVLDATGLARVVEHLLVTRKTGLAALERVVREHSKRGRRGIVPLRDLLDDVALWAKPPDSALEVAFAELLRTHGLPPAEFHRVVRTGGRRFELDFAFVGGTAPVDVEVDGWGTHGGRGSFEADRERDAFLQAAGWVVQRFTWFQVARRPAFVASVLRDVLDRHGYARRPAPPAG